MNYPERIYKQYEVVETMLYGKKHYGVARVYNLFGFEFKIMKKVNTYFKYFDNFTGRRWHPNRYHIISTIENEHTRAEEKFERRVTK